MLENREGGCHCGRTRFRARVDLDLLSQCSCTVCTKKGILHLPVAPEYFELLRGKNSLTSVWHRRGPTHILLALRNARVLCAAFPTRQNHSQCALSRQYRRAEPQAHALLRWPSLGGSPAQTDCRRRARRRCRIERGSHTKDNSGPRSRME
jgi:hypothetical protein